jgi:hypothetical protein
MTALAGTKWSIGYVVDGLLSASYTLYMGNLALQGLSKVAVVARRGVNEALKACYFDTSKSDTLAGKATAWVPERITNFFKDDSGYNEMHDVERDVPVLDKDGKKVLLADKKTFKTEKQEVKEPVHGHVALLVSGLGLSLFALIALEAKETLWRPANPILNGVLSYISPLRAVLGQSWVADGINHLVGAAKAKI